MRLAGIKTGDLVRVKDDATIWHVRAHEGRRLTIWVPRSGATRVVTGFDVVAWWKRMR